MIIIMQSEVLLVASALLQNFSTETLLWFLSHHTALLPPVVYMALIMPVS